MFESACVRTSCYSEDSHDSDDGGIYGQRCAQLQLLQSDSHDGQSHDGDVKLIPPERVNGEASETLTWLIDQERFSLGRILPTRSHLSLKNLWMPKAMSLSRASTTKMQVNT